MDVLIVASIFAVLLTLLIVDLWGNYRGRSYPRHKLTHHKH